MHYMWAIKHHEYHSYSQEVMNIEDYSSVLFQRGARGLNKFMCIKKLEWGFYAPLPTGLTTIELRRGWGGGVQHPQGLRPTNHGKTLQNGWLRQAAILRCPKVRIE
jgi:hypothetical protein